MIREIDAFATLRQSWNDLAARAVHRSVFLTHEWFDAAWQWRKHTARLYILCYAKDNDVLAVCPLVLEDDAHGPCRVRRLEFLTVPDTQLCDVIVAPEHRNEAVAAFGAYLRDRRREWDVLRLYFLPPDSVAATGLAAVLSEHGFRAQRPGTRANPYVPLDTTWDAYYATRSRSLKKANNLAANRLTRAGKVEVEWLTPGTGSGAELDRFVELATAISARSWKVRTKNSLDNPGPQAFIRRLSHHAHERGWLSIWILRLNGEPLAMEYQLIADGSAYALRSDFDSAYDEISPGSHLSRHLLEHLFEQGLRRYLMGPGENAYKLRWTELSEPVEEATVYSRTLRGETLAAWANVVKPAARRIRDLLRRLLRTSAAGRSEAP